MPTSVNFELGERQQDVGRGAGSSNVKLSVIGTAVAVLVVFGFIIGIIMGGGGPECEIASCLSVVIPDGVSECTGAKCESCTAGRKVSPNGYYCALDCELERCLNVTVPESVTTCEEPQVTCQVCESGHHRETDERDLAYCGLNCPDHIKHCEAVTVMRGTTDCATPGGVVCKKCAGGREPMVDAVGSYCGLTCTPENCETYEIGRSSTDCQDAKCTKCSENYQLAVDDNFDFNGKCHHICSKQQIMSGCEMNSCTSSSQCSRCVPGFVWVQTGPSTGGSGACAKAVAAEQMKFYMYRASKNEDYHPENINLASAGGVLWYIHNEVARASCLLDQSTPPQYQRHNQIMRILRYQVTVKNTPEVFNFKDLATSLPMSKQFGHFVQFDAGRCTVANCTEEWWKVYGYMVGCQGAPLDPKTGKVMYESRYAHSYWYSLPGRCPSQEYSAKNKTKECAEEERGGECPKPKSDFYDPVPGEAEDMPTGTRDCTWKAEAAGEVDISELTGIGRTSYQEFCKAGGKEYDASTDKGVGLSFWDKKLDHARNENRTRELLRMFAKNFPDFDSLPDPYCDGF